MNKAEIVEIVAEKSGWTKKDTFKLVDMFLDEIKGCLKKDEEVKISGFGNFKAKTVSTRKAVNPITKEEILVAPSKKVLFKPSEVLKEELL